VALGAIAATKWHYNPFSPLVPPHVRRFKPSAWGWRWFVALLRLRTSVQRGGRMENPQRSYPIALAVVIVTLHCHGIFCRRCFRIAALGDWEKWHTGYFSDAAR